MHLPELWLKQNLLKRDSVSRKTRVEAGPAIVLSGSCSAITNRQVSAFLAESQPGLKLNPLDLAENGADAALAWLSIQSPDAAPTVYATAAPEVVRASQLALGVERAGALVEATLAACAVRARDLGFRRFIIAGGETSGAVAKALGITWLDIGTEIAPGVPWCFARKAGLDVAIALKPGNFGGENFFSRALEVLKA